MEREDANFFLLLPPGHNSREVRSDEISSRAQRHGLEPAVHRTVGALQCGFHQPGISPSMSSLR